MGIADDSLAEQVVSTVQSIVPGDYSPTIKPSSKGNYYAISFDVYFQNYQQVEAMYTQVSALPLVKAVL